MKAFINLLIVTDAYDDPDILLDNIVLLCEQDLLEVIWFKAKEVND